MYVVVHLCIVRAVYSRFEYGDPKNGTYGSKDDNGSWDGVIGMIVDRQAEVGLNVLDFGGIRMDAVDYFPPLWNLK
jgi:hypothetical protein